VGPRAGAVVIKATVTNASEAVPSVRRSLLELGPRARVVFAVLYVGVMLSVVASAQFRPDRVFGFQMFNESSTVNIHLFRRVRTSPRLLPLVNGEFSDGPPGAPRLIRWTDRVHDPTLGRLDVPTHAKYGLEGQLFRLQLALDDFMSELPSGAQTSELVAVVDTVKNGRPPGVVRLHSVSR
jgi:hypothetical protein